MALKLEWRLNYSKYGTLARVFHNAVAIDPAAGRPFPML